VHRDRYHRDQQRHTQHCGGAGDHRSSNSLRSFRNNSRMASNSSSVIAVDLLHPFRRRQPLQAQHLPFVKQLQSGVRVSELWKYFGFGTIVPLSLSHD
jgi:hypothetical protein